MKTKREPIKKKKQSVSPEQEKEVSLKRKYRELDQYKSFFFMNDVPVPDRFLDQLAEDLLEWARKEDSLKLLMFFDEIGVNDRVFYKWSDRNAKLKDAHAWAVRLIGARREIGMIKGAYRDKPVMHTLHQYDPDWKAADEYHVNKAIQTNTPDWVDLRINSITVDKKEE